MDRIRFKKCLTEKGRHEPLFYAILQYENHWSVFQKREIMSELLFKDSVSLAVRDLSSDISIAFISLGSNALHQRPVGILRLKLNKFRANKRYEFTDVNLGIHNQDTPIAVSFSIDIKLTTSMFRLWERISCPIRQYYASQFSLTEKVRIRDAESIYMQRYLRTALGIPSHIASIFFVRNSSVVGLFHTLRQTKCRLANAIEPFNAALTFLHRVQYWERPCYAVLFHITWPLIVHYPDVLLPFLVSAILFGILRGYKPFELKITETKQRTCPVAHGRHMLDGPVSKFHETEKTDVKRKGIKAKIWPCLNRLFSPCRRVGSFRSRSSPIVTPCTNASIETVTDASRLRTETWRICDDDNANIDVSAPPDGMDEEQSEPKNSSEQIEARLSALKKLELKFGSIRRGLRITNEGVIQMCEFAERLHALFLWEDPHVSTLFVFCCILALLLMSLLGSRMVAILAGYYVFRHPAFRDPYPNRLVSLFYRLPTRDGDLHCLRPPLQSKSFHPP